MRYSDFAVGNLVRRLAELSMKRSTPKRLAGVLFEAMEVIQQLQKQTAPPPNEPLSLEQLRAMEGEPVWCNFSEESDCPGSCYMIIQWHNSEFFKSYECGSLFYEEYGKSWIAYRRRPEAHS